MDPYSEAHLFTAALRILHHRKQAPPSIDEISELLEISTEAGLAICRTLEKKEIVSVSEDPFSIRVSLEDHLAIENLPRQQDSQDSLANDLETFKAKKKDMDRQVEAIQADLKKKKRDMQSDFEARLKKELEKSQNR